MNIICIAGGAEPETMVELVKFVGGLGGVGVMTLVTWLWLTGKIVTRRELDDADKRTQSMLGERDKWQATTLRLLETAEQNLDSARTQTVTAARAVDTAAAVVVGAIRDNSGGPR